MTEIHGIVTMGLLIETGGVRILTDPFSCLKGAIFPLTGEDDLRAIVEGAPPYDGIDLLLLSHNHKDHFHPGHAAEMLHNNPKLHVVGPPCVIQTLEGHGLPQQLHAVGPGLYQSEELSFGGIRVQAARTLHTGKQFADTEHLSYLIHGDHDLLFAGDAVASEENFGAFRRDKPVDLLIATFPFLTTSNMRGAVEQYLQPEAILAVHLPVYEGEGRLWTDQAVIWRDKLVGRGGNVVLFQKPGERLALP